MGQRADYECYLESSSLNRMRFVSEETTLLITRSAAMKARFIPMEACVLGFEFVCINEKDNYINRILFHQRNRPIPLL